MIFNKFLKYLFLVIYLGSIVHANGLKLVKKHEVKTPENCKVHSVSGIFYNNAFVLAYYVGQSSYEHLGVAKSKQYIAITRGTPGNWQTPSIAAIPDEVGMSDCACFDPVLFQNDGKIYLFYKVGHSPRDWSGFIKISYDGGYSWAGPISLPENILGPAKCRPLVSVDGNDLICGASFQREKAKTPPCQDGWVSIDILRNFKKEESFAKLENWERGRFLAYQFKGAASVVVQPAIWQNVSNAQIFHMLCRSNTGMLVYACSFDGGHTWTEAVDSELPSNYSAIDILRTAHNRVFMAWNPLLSGQPVYDARWRLVVSELVGNDPKLANSWNERLVLEHDECKKTEYSFPSIISCHDRLFVAYGINRSNIILAEIEMVG